MVDDEARSVVLDTSDGRFLWASRGDDGSLRLHGQDLNEEKLAEIFGPGVDEYEWVHTVRPADLPTLLAALGEPPDADVLEVAERHADTLTAGRLDHWFEQLGIDPDFWSRTSNSW